MSRRRTMLALLVVAAVATWVLSVEVGAPADVGRWAPVALDGLALTAVGTVDDALVVGGPTGARRLDDAGVTDLEVDANVNDLLEEEDELLAATGEGVLALAEPGAHRVLALDGEPVDALLHHDGAVLAVAGGGVVDVAGDAAVLGPDAGVRAAASVDGDLLLGLDDGVGRLDEDGQLQRLWDGPAVDLLAGVPDGGGKRLLAAVRESEPLLAASDPGGPWEASDDGIRVATVEAIAEGFDGDGHVLAGGTGLDDGETGERGGVADSDDSGRTWTNEQDRLAAVHVYDFTTRDEPLRLEVALAGRDLGTVAVPLQRPYTYAGTNGAGLYRRQPELPGAAAAAALEPTGRLLAPAALGALALWTGWQGFQRLAGRAPAKRPDVRPGHDTRRRRRADTMTGQAPRTTPTSTEQNRERTSR